MGCGRVGTENPILVILLDFFSLFLFLPKKVILDTERSKIANVQKWCRNGVTTIIKGVVSNFRFLKNQSRIYECKFEKKLIFLRIFGFNADLPV